MDSEHTHHPGTANPGDNPFDFSGSGGGLEGLGDLGDLAGLLSPRGLPADPKVLERNLIALFARNRALAQRLATTHAREGVVLEAGADGVVTGTMDGRRLGSARRAGDEARTLAETVDPEESAAACVLGFGLGHHVRALQERMGIKSVIAVYEPNLGLLRAVFERVDHSAWLALGRCVIVDDAEDAAGLTRSLAGFEGLLALGVKIVEHPASRSRLGESAAAFGRTMGAVVRSNRTHIVTTLVHAPVTMRNMVMNADRYASCAGIGSLEGACAGHPAVTVAAGPSLKRNMALLGRDGVRDRAVIIAAQTVLRPMLAAGIRPHFVTALDHHELSGRFYEGLTADDVRGVRLIVEPKANPVIFEKFPGEILVTQESVLDKLIGPALGRTLGELPAGATVAHLSYFLARYLGCDPVIMIGQDLAFTDGQYYSEGAAIHRVWQGELNDDRTLEMLEWERVARMRGTLRRVPGHGGRPLYADEQMATYLAQFESEFQKDEQRGLCTIDATEGGAVKRHTTRMTLSAALERYADRALPALPDTSRGARATGEIRAALRAHWDGLRADAEEIVRASRETGEALGTIADPATTIACANELVGVVQRTGERVRALKPAFELVEFINQTGVLNRFRADRKIELGDDDPRARQRRQAERDRTNVEWIAAAGEELGRTLALGAGVLDGARDKATRDEPTPEDSARTTGGPCDLFVLCDPAWSGLGTRRDLAKPVWAGRDALSLTLARALRCRSVRAVRVLTPDPATTNGLIERAGFAGRVTVEALDAERWRDRARAIGVARANGATSWRGGVGQTCVHDEQFDPIEAERVMDAHGCASCAVIGADWALIDPALIDACVDRHNEAPKRHQIVFTQATPGLGPCVLGRDAVGSLAELQRLSSPLGTVGGLLGYVPVNTQTDPIGTTLCVPVDPRVRDCGLRLIADSTPGVRLVQQSLERLGERATDSSSLQSARAGLASGPDRCPRRVVLELCPGRLSSAVFGAWKRGSSRDTERTPIDIGRAHRLFGELASAREDACLTLDGPGDPLMHPGVLDFVRLGDELGIGCVSMRTDLLREGAPAEEIIDSGLGVLSVDLLATDAGVYAALTGVDRYEAVLGRLGSIADARVAGVSGLRSPWILPRMTRCDAVLEQVEGFYDAWIMAVGAAAIDAQPAWVSDRVRPLPIPNDRLAQLERDTLRVRCDGVVCDHAWRAVPGIDVFEVGLVESTRLWRAHLESGERRATRRRAGAAA